MPLHTTAACGLNCNPLSCVLSIDKADVFSPPASLLLGRLTEHRHNTFGQIRAYRRSGRCCVHPCTARPKTGGAFFWGSFPPPPLCQTSHPPPPPRRPARRLPALA